MAEIYRGKFRKKQLCLQKATRNPGLTKLSSRNCSLQGQNFRTLMPGSVNIQMILRFNTVQIMFTNACLSQGKAAQCQSTLRGFAGRVFAQSRRNKSCVYTKQFKDTETSSYNHIECVRNIVPEKPKAALQCFCCSFL